MTRNIGRLLSVGIGKETTRGTAVAPQYWIPVRDLDFDDKFDTKDNESGYGVIAAYNDSDVIKQWSEGSYNGKILDRSIGAELSAVFGQAPASVQRSATGVYDHTYSMLNTNQHRSMTIAIKEPNNDLRYPNAVVDSWNFEAALDDYARREVGWKGKKSASASNTVAYTTTENEFVPRHASCFLATALSGLDAASALKVNNITLNINKNAEELQVLGSNDVDDVVNKQVEVEGSVEVYYDDTSLRTLAFNNTKRAIRIALINTDVTIGTGTTTNPQLRFDLAQVVFTNWERGFDNNDVMTQTLEFKGMYSLTDTQQVVARLTNDYAGTNYA